MLLWKKEKAQKMEQAVALREIFLIYYSHYAVNFKFVDKNQWQIVSDLV